MRTDARLSGGVDRIGAVGNTVQVQIPQLIGNAILRTEREKRFGAKRFQSNENGPGSW